MPSKISLEDFEKLSFKDFVEVIRIRNGPKEASQVYNNIISIFPLKTPEQVEELSMKTIWASKSSALMEHLQVEEWDEAFVDVRSHID